MLVLLMMSMWFVDTKSKLRWWSINSASPIANHCILYTAVSQSVGRPSGHRLSADFAWTIIQRPLLLLLLLLRGTFKSFVADLYLYHAGRSIKTPLFFNKVIILVNADLPWIWNYSSVSISISTDFPWISMDISISTDAHHLQAYM